MSGLDNSSDNDIYFSFSSSSDSSSDLSYTSIPTLSDTIKSYFSDVPKNFNVIHINAQSIPAHYSDMLASFDCNNLHAILVSESWLKPCLTSTLYPLPGFHLIRNDRTGSGGGGVAIYLRTHIPYSVVSTSAQPPPPNAGEHLFVEVLLSHTKILLGVYYSPSLRVNFFSSFETLLESFIPSYNHSIIMGDFNTCLIKKDNRSLLFEDVIKSNNLHILSSGATHHFPNSSPSLLDLVVVSSLPHVAKHGQYPADSFSYHDLLFLSYKIRPPKVKPKSILQRNFSGMDHDAFLDEARNLDWSSVLNTESIDDQVNNFNYIITQLYDKFAPMRTIKLKHLPAPWLTADIKQLIHKKVVAKSKFKCHPNEYYKTKYIKIRNHCNMVCRDAFRRHIHNSVDVEDPAKVWRFLRSIGIGKTRSDSIPKDLDINSLNSYFSSSSDINDTDKLNTLHLLSNISTPDYPSFIFNNLSGDDVKKSLLSITSNAIGSDGISRNMLVPILDSILPILCVIFNNSLQNGVFPSIWKNAQIIPLPKKLNPISFSEYRPISILPFLSKVLERLVHNQLSKFISCHNLLNPLQSGFRPGHSTVTTLVKITDDIRYGMENGYLTVLTLLDFSNAFNTVNFDILLALLSSLNISSNTIEWFRSYLLGRKQRIRLEDNFSSWCSTSAGVPQGGVLSPLLFTIFINSISKNLSSSYHLYADDLQIYAQAPLHKLEDAVNSTNADLRRIAEWSKSFGLKVNPIKTQVIVIGSSRLLCKINWNILPRVTFDGIDIPYTRTVKNLGLVMDDSLSWGPQLQATSRKLYGSAASLKRLQNFLPTSTKIALAKSLLLPVLDYADACFLDLTEDQLNKLERLQNFCIRFIFGLRKFDHVSQFRSKLKWLPIRFRRNTHILSLLYNILFNPSSPQYLKERFLFPDYGLRSSENLTLKMPSHSTNFYDNSFTVQAIRLWNSLPVSIRRAQSVNVFKDQVQKFYLNK